MSVTRKTIVVLLAACLVGAALAGPAGAAKKKPARGLQTYYLVNTSEEDGCPDEHLVLRLTPTSENGSQCINAQEGLPNEAVATASGEPCIPVVSRCGSRTFNADEGLPLVLDARQPLTGAIHVSSAYLGAGTPPLSAGPATLHVTLRATIGGAETVLGTSSVDYTVTPTQRTYEVPFEIEVDDALDKAELSTLAIQLWNGGVAPAQTYETNASHVVVPVWRKR